MAAEVGALRVTITVETGEFEQGLKKATGGLKDFAKQAAAVAAGIKLEKIFDQITDAIVKGVSNAIDAMDKLGKESQKIGVSVENLSALTLAAGLSDVSVTQLSKSMAKLAKGMVDSDKETGDVKRALDALGISADNFKKLKPEQQLELLAEKFAGAEDSAAKTAIAIALFGQKIGTAMIPLLNTGAKGLQEIKEQAEKFNLIISKDTAKQAEGFQDNLKRLSAAGQGFYNVIASLVLPRLEELSNTMVQGALATNGYRSVAEAFGRALRFVADNSTVFITAILAITLAISPLLLKITILTAGILALSYVFAAMAGSDLVTVLKNAGLNVSALTMTTEELKKSLLGSEDAAKKLALQMKSKEAAQITENLKKKVSELNAEFIQTSNFFAGVLPEGFIKTAISLKVMKEDMVSTKNIMTLWTGDTITLTAEQEKLRLAMLNLEAAKLSAEFLTPWDQYQLKLDAINRALGAQFPISADVAAKASAKAAAELTKQYADAGAAIAGSMSEAFTAIGGEQKSWVRASKIAMAVQALLSAYAGASSALVGPFPANIAAAATVLAKGLSLAAAIKATPLGFAHGGSFMVPGSGGVDSYPVRFMATPGEKVTVETPGQQRKESSQTVVLRGSSFHINEVRDLFDYINAGLGDGHKFKVVTG